jgi:hypothetical protein
METSHKHIESHPGRNNTLRKLRRLFYSAVIAVTAINPACASEQKAKEAQTTPKKYNFTKGPEIRKVKRSINFCAASIKDLKAEAARCIRDVLIQKENGLHCLRCTTEAEEVKYQ